MKFTLLLLLILYSYTVHAQTDSLIVVAHVERNTIIEVFSEYPGGIEAWHNFLLRNLNYPEWALRRGIRGTVLVKFVVETDGAITNIKAVCGPSELRQSAIDAIKKSPKWRPASKNGVPIKSEKTQPINFG